MLDLPHLPLPKEDLRELQQFCSQDADRQEILEKSLRRRGISHKIIPIGETRHIAIPIREATKIDSQYYRITLISHYDRVHGTPGANDNSACIFQLMNHWEEISRLGWQNNTQILFTDKEELTGNMKPSEQGAYFLAKHFRRLKVQNLLFFVLDMCGIGNTPVWGFSLKKSGTRQVDNPISSIYKMVGELLKKYSGGQDFGVNPMFSDDLGLLLGGYPAIRLTILPRKEAFYLAKQYRQIRAKPDESVIISQKIDLPKTWKASHGPDDSIDKLDSSAFLLMARILRDLAKYRFPLPRFTA